MRTCVLVCYYLAVYEISIEKDDAAREAEETINYLNKT